MSFLPHFKITSRGYSGNSTRTIRIPYLLTIIPGGDKYPEVSVYSFIANANPEFNNRLFNPYRDISHGGTLLGFRKRNYWIADDTLLGKLIKPLFS